MKSFWKYLTSSKRPHTYTKFGAWWYNSMNVPEYPAAFFLRVLLVLFILFIIGLAIYGMVTGNVSLH